MKNFPGNTAEAYTHVADKLETDDYRPAVILLKNEWRRHKKASEGVPVKNSSGESARIRAEAQAKADDVLLELDFLAEIYGRPAVWGDDILMADEVDAAFRRVHANAATTA